MKRRHVPEEVRVDIIRGFADILDFRRLLPGQRYFISLDENDRLLDCRYEAGPVEIYSLHRRDEELTAARLPVSLEARRIRLAGTIETSLFAAFMELREKPPLIYAFADIFASRIDFNTETRRGDSFEVVVEKYFKDGRFIGYGRIVLARYRQKDRELTGYYYSSDQAPAGYYDRNGEELGSSFIRSPVPLGQVTSSFTLRRKHPILGVVRPHLGIDLAAPVGTPVMATADGRIEFIGYQGGFGNQVVLVHSGGYKTYYGHLSGFRKGLRKGSRVEQKDVIGYVGSTGLSTGPHLDYRLQKDGVFKNPFAIKFRPKTVLAGEELQHLTARRKELDLLLAEADSDLLLVREVLLASDQRLVLL